MAVRDARWHPGLVGNFQDVAARIVPVRVHDVVRYPAHKNLLQGGCQAPGLTVSGAPEYATSQAADLIVVGIGFVSKNEKIVLKMRTINAAQDLNQPTLNAAASEPL